MSKPNNLSPTGPRESSFSEEDLRTSSSRSAERRGHPGDDRFKKLMNKDSDDDSKKTKRKHESDHDDEDEKPSLFGLAGVKKDAPKKGFDGEMPDSHQPAASTVGELMQSQGTKGEIANVTDEVAPESKTPISHEPEGDEGIDADGAARAFVKVPTEPKIAQVQTPTVAEQLGQTSRLTAQERIDLINQIVDAVATVISKDLTTTTLTLNQPPLFAGATIQITEFNSAQNQFNITFGQLSPDARRLLESVENQSALRLGLIEKGYTLQMITIESDIGLVQRPTAASESSRGDQRGRGQGEEERGEKREGGQGGQFA